MLKRWTVWTCDPCLWETLGVPLAIWPTHISAHKHASKAWFIEPPVNHGCGAFKSRSCYVRDRLCGSMARLHYPISLNEAEPSAMRVCVRACQGEIIELRGLLWRKARRSKNWSGQKQRRCLWEDWKNLQRTRCIDVTDLDTGPLCCFFPRVLTRQAHLSSIART